MKLCQLVLELLAKNRFSAAVLYFPDETGSRFFYTIYFSNHFHRTWKFAFRIFKISHLFLELLAKNRFSAANLHFLHENGSRFIKPIFFTNHYYRTWKFAIKISKTRIKVKKWHFFRWYEKKLKFCSFCENLLFNFQRIC